MMKIQINGKHYEVKADKNLLEVSLALGINVPHFCYHAALGSVGACRVCAVKKYKDESDEKGKLIMSCMEPVADGMIVTTEDPASRLFRKNVLESLMLNHPHDCPVCDEGGECHLQDMTVMTGHNYRNYYFKKRTYTNQYLGPFIHHEMNRCIQCYRCVRFYKDYAGGKDLNVFAAHDHVYFGRKEEGVLESEFSGNLVEVCPTGVFTDKTLKKHFTRKWDLSNAPSVCVHCSVGCNTIASERYGVLRRIMSRYNGAVNGYFLCDRGRFGYEFVNAEGRVRKTMTRSSKSDKATVVDQERLQLKLSAALKGKKVIGIGSHQASLESNYALSALVGDENFYHGISPKEFDLTQTALEILRNTPAHVASLKEIEKADAVLVLGEDLTNTAPLIALAVRQAARNIPFVKGENAGIPKWHDTAQREIAQDLKSPVFVVHPHQTKLDELSKTDFTGTLDDVVSLGFAVAAELNGKAPTAGNLKPDQKQLAKEIAGILKDAKNPVIISGIHSGSKQLLMATANITSALHSEESKEMLHFVYPEANSAGLGMMNGESLDKALSVVENEDVDTLVVLENDLFRHAAKDSIDNLIATVKNVIVLEHTQNETTAKGDILIPVGTFAESEGTLVNSEGRAQRFYRVFPLENSVLESWRVIGEMLKIKQDLEKSPWKTFDQLSREMGEKIPVFASIAQKMPDREFQVLNEKIRRQTIRFSGRTAINANIDVSEHEPPFDPDSPLAFTMEGSEERPPSSLVPYYWTPGWNSPQSLNFYLIEPNGSMKGGDPGIRLIDTNQTAEISFFEPEDRNDKQEIGAFDFIPVYSIFGSEELSARSPAVKERIPEPFILVNAKNAKDAGIEEGGQAIIEINGQKLEVKVRIDEKIPAGMVGFSVKLPGMPYLELPAKGKIIGSENGNKNLTSTGS